MTTIEIMFADLKEYKQNELLKAFDVKSPKYINWDIFPIDIIETDTTE